MSNIPPNTCAFPPYLIFAWWTQIFFFGGGGREIFLGEKKFMVKKGFWSIMSLLSLVSLLSPLSLLFILSLLFTVTYFLSLVAGWVLKFCQTLLLRFLSQLNFLSQFFSAMYCYLFKVKSFQVCHNLGCWLFSQFRFCNKLICWVLTNSVFELSQFEYLIFVTIWILYSFLKLGQHLNFNRPDVAGTVLQTPLSFIY